MGVVSVSSLTSLGPWIGSKAKKACRTSSVTFLTFIICLIIVGLATTIMPHLLVRVVLRGSTDRISVWLIRSEDGLSALPVAEERVQHLYPADKTSSFDPYKSPFMLAPGSHISNTIYTKKKPVDGTRVYTVGYYDPDNALQFLGRTEFDECEYNNCRMTQHTELADVVLFYVAKLTISPPPRFKRRPGQIWVFYTNEAPSRFSWFVSVNRTGIREQINWTMTHKLDSDIPIVYGRLMEIEQPVEKDYDEIYAGKTRTATWFVSHCPVRSDRLLYVARMQKRIDVDVFGSCGTLSCGQAEIIPGVAAMRIDADRNTCFPLMSKTYKFYLAFENSLCQEYVTEKFFKLFNNVDVVPVVRGGADYKRYFPPGTFVDAADFSSPEALADFLDDLGNDKSRYISYLKNKNRYQAVGDSPNWQCKLCEKLHVDRQEKSYENIHAWFTTNSCVDPMDVL